MNFTLLKLHPRMIVLTLSIIVLALLLCNMMGTTKLWQEIDWWDVLGEGGIVLLTILWQFFLLLSRPPGRVTTLLTVGLCCLFVVMREIVLFY